MLACLFTKYVPDVAEDTLDVTGVNVDVLVLLVVIVVVDIVVVDVVMVVVVVVVTRVVVLLVVGVPFSAHPSNGSSPRRNPIFQKITK